MKKLFTSVLLIAFCLWLTVQAGLSSQQENTIKIAASKIIALIEKSNTLTIDKVVDTISTTKNNPKVSSTGNLILTSLLNQTLDKFYKVENFAQCTSYYDWCNTCTAKDGKLGGCTKMYCVRSAPAECKAYNDSPKDEKRMGFSCTDAEKQAEICTMEYAPVCGDNGKTYGNKCGACASKEIENGYVGECIDPNSEIKY